MSSDRRSALLFHRCSKVFIRKTHIFWGHKAAVRKEVVEFVEFCGRNVGCFACIFSVKSVRASWLTDPSSSGGNGSARLERKAL